MKSSWQDLPLRIVSALVILPVVVACIFYGHIPYIIMVCLVTVAMIVEWANLFKFNVKTFKGILYIIWPLIAYYAALTGMWWQAIIIVVGFAFIFGPQLWLGSVVVGLAGLSLLWLRLMTQFEMWAVLFVIFVVIASDSFAYIVGKIFGGPKLMPSVSPGKTWSGAIGGLFGAGCIGSLIVGFVCGETYFDFIGGAILGMLTGIVAQIGDLLESKLKRELGVKDSGKIIPGHGGVLDRCDALILASIFIAGFSLFVSSNHSLRAWGGDLFMTVTAYNQK